MFGRLDLLSSLGFPMRGNVRKGKVRTEIGNKMRTLAILLTSFERQSRVIESLFADETGFVWVFAGCHWGHLFTDF